MKLISSPNVSNVFQSWPELIRDNCQHLRKLILETATELDIKQLEETLKWGEPAYLTKSGSTIRIAWKASYPDQYGLYFNCNTRLVDTFKELYSDKFYFEGNRAIIFQTGEALPEPELKHCMLLSLSYHSRKHLPLLGS